MPFQFINFILYTKLRLLITRSNLLITPAKSTTSAQQRQLFTAERPNASKQHTAASTLAVFLL